MNMNFVSTVKQAWNGCRKICWCSVYCQRFGLKISRTWQDDKASSRAVINHFKIVSAAKVFERVKNFFVTRTRTRRDARFGGLEMTKQKICKEIHGSNFCQKVKKWISSFDSFLLNRVSLLRQCNENLLLHTFGYAD